MRLKWGLIVLSLMLLAGCSGGPGAAGLMVGDGGSSNIAEGFALQILNDGRGTSSLPGDAWLDVRSLESGAVAVDVLVSEAQGLEALYCAVDYDAGAFTPVSAQASGLLGHGDDLLELAVLSEPGTAYFGQELVRMEGAPAGFCRDGIAAKFVFEQVTYKTAKCTSRAPQGKLNEFGHWYDNWNDEHRWYYTNAGDYNQDSEVGIMDLASVARLYGSSIHDDDIAPDFFIVDGDQNYEINQADIAVIAMNFGVSIW